MMALLDVVFRLLDKAGTGFIEPRREDGHGSDVETPSHVVMPLPDGAATEAKQLPDNHQVFVSNHPAEFPLPAAQLITLTPQTDALTDAQLRAAPVEITGSLTIDPPALQQVADDYQTGEILPDQIGANGVLTFTFSAAVQNLWVYAVAADPDVSGEVRVDPFGGTPSASLGIPVAYGGITPIPTTATVVRVFAATGIRVTVYGNRRG